MTIRNTSPLRVVTLALLCGGIATVRAASDASVYTTLITPLLEAKCVSCHGEEKPKGKLRMDSFEALLKGGNEGPALVPGKLDDSLMLVRIALPKDDDEHMPPEDKEQLTEAEVQLLRKWVEKGGSQSLTAKELGLDEAMVKQLLAGIKEAAPVEVKVAAPVALVEAAVREKTMKEVNATGASLMQVAQDTPLFRFSALNVVDRFGDEELKQLAPVAPDVIWMDLARTKVTNSGLTVLASMKNLTKLHLENTGVTDEGLAHLRGLSQLEYLNLYKTEVTDRGLDQLKGLKNLKRLYLWQSKATPAGAEQLRKSIPGLVVNLGWEFEPKVEVAAVAPAATPAAAPVTPAPAPAKPAVATATPTTPAPAKPAVAPVTPAPAPAKPAVAPVTPAPAPAKPVAPVTPTPAPAKPVTAPAPPATSTAAPVKPEGAKSSGVDLSGVRDRLREAHAEATRLVAEAQTQSAAAEARAKEAQMKMDQGKAQVAANQKAAAEAKASEGPVGGAVKALETALNEVRGKAGLENIEKSVAADLAEAKKLAEQAKQKLLIAEQGLKTANDMVAQSQAKVTAETKAASEAKAQVPDLQAVANAVKQALDLAQK